MAPFLIFGLPRSRTAWLASFLTHGGYFCAHEQLRHARTVDDVRRWLAQDWTGAAETMAAPWWRLARHLRPDVRVLVVRRPPAVVTDSLMQLGLGFDEAATLRTMQYLDQRLDLIEARVPGVLSVRYSELAEEATCRAVYEHCLGLSFDAAWWSTWDGINVQCDMRAMARHSAAHVEPMAKLQADATRRTKALLFRGGVPLPAGIGFYEETFDGVWGDVQRLAVEHMAEVGPHDDQGFEFNTPLVEQIAAKGALHIATARRGCQIVGYITAVISPIVEDRHWQVAIQGSMFVHPDCRGIGPRLQRWSNELLRLRGVNELMLRAGVRGAGSRVGVLYRRMGAVPNGELYSLNLGAA